MSKPSWHPTRSASMLIFMVAGIYFAKQLRCLSSLRLLLSIPSKRALSLAFCLVAAFLSAFPMR